MNAKQRYNKRRNDLVLKLHVQGLHIDEVVKQSRKSLLHVTNLINRAEARGE